MHENRTIVYFSLGSNLGDRISNLRFGLDNLATFGTDWVVSPVYETQSWGYTDTPYLNMAVQMETLLSPQELMVEIENIEKKSGRTAKPAESTDRYEARTLDIDILFYGSEIIEKTNLNIPHPRLHLRNFVLFPLADIAADFVHPQLGTTIAELKNTTTDTSEIHHIAKRI